MEKIDFKNLPNTSTPFTAENFNQLQTNIENAIESKHKFNCMVATTISTQTASSSYIVNLDAIAISKGSKLTLENGAIKIGEGVSKVRVSGAIFIDGWAGGDSYLWGIISKNGQSVSSMLNSGTSYYLSASIPTTIIDVEEGDYIELIADSGSGGTIRAGGANTFLCVEVID